MQPHIAPTTSYSSMHRCMRPALQLSPKLIINRFRLRENVSLIRRSGKFLPVQEAENFPPKTPKTLEKKQDGKGKGLQ